MLFALEVHMSEEDLELLITLDEPSDGHEDTFNHLQAENTVAYRPGQPLPSRRRPDQRTEVIVDNDPPKLDG
jgi:hypothetical protein